MLKALGQSGDFGFGGAHLQFGVVLLDLLAHLTQLVAGVLDLLEIVLVGGLVHLELLFMLRQFLLGLLQLQCELGGGFAIARLEISLGLGLELLHVVAAGGTPGA